jgi:hypothetical protein
MLRITVNGMPVGVAEKTKRPRRLTPGLSIWLSTSPEEAASHVAVAYDGL